MEKLDCSYCTGINNVHKFSHTLKELRCDFSGIDQDGISRLLCLEKISFSGTNIHTVDHLSTSLKYIKSEIINQDMIKNMKCIQEIHLACHSITNLDHLKESLTTLDVGVQNSIDYNIIKNLSRLRYLRAREITNLPQHTSIYGLEGLIGELREIHLYDDLQRYIGEYIFEKKDTLKINVHSRTINNIYIIK